MLLYLLAGPAADQAVQAGDWAVKSTVVELSVPGVPSFVQRMARGRSKLERKRLAAGQGMEALLAPDPKAGCRVETQTIAAGRYAQVIICPQKKGEPMRVSRAGTFDGRGFAGRATVSGTTSKGPLNIVLDQSAAHVGG